MISSRDLTAVILAGGVAQKAGAEPPCLLDVDGRKLIERQAQLLKPKVSRIEVSVSAPAPWSRFPVTLDDFDPIGPLAGIASSLKHAATDYVLVIGARFATINPDVLDLLVARSGEPFDACAIRFNFANPNPLFAIYHKRCAKRAIERIERGEHDAMGLLTSESLAVRWIEDYELASLDPELQTFKLIDVAGSEAARAPVEPGAHRFAFQAKPAYQTTLALIPHVHALAKHAEPELAAQLVRHAHGMLVGIASGTVAPSAVHACAALVDAIRVTGGASPVLGEVEVLLATLGAQLDQ